MKKQNTFRHSQVLGTPNTRTRASARQQVYTSLRATDQQLNLLGRAPVIGISAPTGDNVSCNMLTERISELILNELKKRKLLGLRSPITGVSDGVLNGHPNMGYSLHSRNAIANQVGFSSDQYNLDAHVGIFACDKTGPGLSMGYSSLYWNDDARTGSVPSVMMYGGSTIPGFCHLAPDNKQVLDQKLEEAGIIEDGHDIVTGFKLDEAVENGTITLKQMEEIIRHTVEAIGACQGMYTANTMAIALEVLGMTPPESSQQVTTDQGIFEMVTRTVDCVETCIEQNITPNKIITPESLRNALAITNALGGSTNAVLHLIALGNRLGITLNNEFFQEVRNKTPLVGNMKPFGTGNMIDFIQNGDLKRVLQRMIDQDMIDGSCLTVTGSSLGDNVESMETKEPTNKKTLYTFEDPLRNKGNLVVLEGNLADHAVMKVTADSEKSFTGKAICFNSEQDAIDGILGGKVKNGHVVVIRYVGPKAAAMPEMLYPTSCLKAVQGLTEVALISDGRFSGGSYGAVVGHITPEAADGGAIGKLKDGDIIRIDSDSGTLEVLDVNLSQREASPWEDLRNRFDPTKQFSALMTRADVGADYLS